jgi:hypothetical protein
VRTLKANQRDALQEPAAPQSDWEYRVRLLSPEWRS